MQYAVNRKRVTHFKKLIPNMALILLGMMAGAAISLVLYVVTEGGIYKGLNIDSSRYDGGQVTNADITDTAYTVLKYIKSGDYSALSQAVHTEYGVVFSPYATVTLSSNKCFTAEQVSGFANDETVYLWGVYDGSGDPIELTPRDYFSKFVFDRDFENAHIIGVNRVVKSGNALENFSDAFPNARFVDFHIPGGDTEFEDLGWSSLRLGFEEFGGKLKLTVILHSEWTV